MPVRLRITFIFTIIVFCILSLVCSTVYYYSYNHRLRNVRTRLTNRALTIARLLSQSETFNPQLIQKIDSSTAFSLTRKTIQAYDYLNTKIYSFSDHPNDTLPVDKQTLDDARVHQTTHFTINDKDVVAYHYADARNRMVIVAAGYDEAGRRNLQQLSTILWLSFLGGVAITFISGYFFSRQLLSPIKKIADEVNEISVQNLTRRIPTGKVKDEWNYIANILNLLLNRMQESFDTQRRFIANASHELSTPLTAISSQLEVALQRKRAADEYQSIMQSIYQDVRQMSKLTQTLLQFAKASGTPGGIEIHQIRIDEVLLRMPAEIIKANKNYSVVLQFEELPEEENLLIVFGNEELLFMALKNIVINACKYSENHEAIIRLSVKELDIIISIQDKGIGIPADEIKNIFEPFYRVDESRHSDGFGLGLSLAYRIVKLHNGEVSVQSKRNEGTLFTITLPSFKREKNF